MVANVSASKIAVNPQAKRPATGKSCISESRGAPVARSNLAKRMLHDMQLAGLQVRTQIVYLWVIRKLAEYTQLAPDKIAEQQLREYLLYIKNEKHFARGSLSIAYSAIRFFFTHTVRRNWLTLRNMRIPKE